MINLVLFMIIHILNCEFMVHIGYGIDTLPYWVSMAFMILAYIVGRKKFEL